MRTTRRDLLRYFTSVAGCSIAAASVAPLSGCVTPHGAQTDYRFPQGVASADPQSDAVVIWTRVTKSDALGGAGAPIALVAQLARDEAFTELLAEESIVAEETLDHSVRVLITELEPDRHYYYRFIAPDGGVSRTGRTRTAPAADSERPLNVAVFSCQDYEQGFFTAYRRLILDDRAAPEDRRIDFVIHVGDFIYETIRGPDTVGEVDLNGAQIDLVNADGSRRRVGPFPSGGGEGGRGWIVPTTLEDFRHLYRIYLTDPDLQDARALYPFVTVWDDHELLNDYWQSYYKDRSVAGLKVASNQAWFEYMPAALSAGGRDVANHHAADFAPVDVADAPPTDFDEDFLSQESNNLAAIGSVTIYRALRWGRTADLFMIDGRSYRGPRGLPQELLTIGRHPYPEAPVDPGLIMVLNEGREALGGSPPEEVTYLGQTIPNPRKGAPRSSMLGRRQKEWLLAGLRESTAAWKLLGLNVGLMQHGFDDSFRDEGDVNRILWTDGWDGYPSERRELTTFIRDEKIANVVSLTGDRHAHMAGVIYDDFGTADPLAVATELAGGAVSAPSRLIIQRVLSAHDDELARLVSFDGAAFGHDQAIMPSLNAWMVHGAAAARALAEGADDATAVSLTNPHVNPHLAYVDSDAYGYFVARFTTAAVEAEFVTVAEPIRQAVGEAPVRRRVRFSAAATTTAGGEPRLDQDDVEGERPLGGLKS